MRDQNSKSSKISGVLTLKRKSTKPAQPQADTAITADEALVHTTQPVESLDPAKGTEKKQPEATQPVSPADELAAELTASLVSDPADKVPCNAAQPAAHDPIKTGEESPVTQPALGSKIQPMQPETSQGCTDISSVEAAEATATENTQSDEQDQLMQQQPAVRNMLPGAHWQALAEAVVGLAHRDAASPLPCQDSANASCKPRALVVVADGAGSSAVSEIGSQAVVTGLSRLLNTLEQQVAILLDDPEPDEQKSRDFSLLLVKHALGILQDLSSQHRRSLKDFRCTLLLAVHGKHNTLWLKIGDGALVGEQISLNGGQRQPKLFTLGEVGKGEFANLTTFVDDHLQPSDVQSGLYPSALLTGLAAMSDGAADRLVANDGSRVAGRVSDWLDELRHGKLKRRNLVRAFYADDFTRGTTGDDCSIALAACELAQLD